MIDIEDHHLKWRKNFSEKDECITWLKNRGISTSGSLQELKMRINRFKLYPLLAEKLRLKTEKNFNFGTSLDPVNIPPPL